MDSTTVGSSTATALKSFSFLSLPEEIQEKIVGHCPQADWVRLSLVSRHFHELAAAQLYRNFHIVFPDDDDANFDSPTDGLASGLDTFVTSEYNYAKRLRDITLDTLSTGPKAEAAYKVYAFSASCGKFMNTLLLLTLRKAKALDTFKWNIRVELSRPVYKALHGIKSLRHLHLRLQAGPSTYETSALTNWPTQPQPLMPVTVNITPGQTIEPLSLFQTISTTEAPSSFPEPYMMPVPFLTPAAPAPDSSSGKHSNKSTPVTKPSTLSGFNGLETLSILDIDDLDIVSEIRSCVRNSAKTLRHLQLSFSDNLAMQARKPIIEVDSEDSDQEDDFQILPASAPPPNDGTGPAKIFRAQQERKIQEAVLGQIFGDEPHVIDDHQQEATKGDNKKDKAQTPEAAAQNFINAVGDASRRMWANLEGSSRFDTVSQEEALARILEAAEIVVESKEAQNQETTSTDATVPAAVSPDLTTSEPVPQNASSEQNGSLRKTSTAGSGLFGPRGGAENVETSPEDIDIEAPEEQLSIEGEPSVEAPSDETITGKQPVSPRKESHRVAIANEDTVSRTEETSTQVDVVDNSTSNVKRGDTVVAEAEKSDSDAQNMVNHDKKEDLEHQVTEYARGTRGISLEHLTIYLIPTKPRVLSKAIDLRTLKSISLLNVGPQSSIWTTMMKENAQGPLPLRRISTDNVCPAMLTLASQLKRVDEIYLRERGLRSKPESFAPKTTMKIEHIRKRIIKVHMETIKVLMIKNEADSSWDIDEKTMRIICKRGKALEEMAVSMGMHAMHTFCQRMTGVPNLLALHVLSFRSDDMCHSAMREMRRFIVDALSHQRDMKLEWIAVGDDDSAQQVVRPKNTPTPKKTDNSKKSDGKWKAPPVDANGNPTSGGGPYPQFPGQGWESDSESEDDESDPGLKGYAISENIPFYDIWGVKIFRKEIIAGRP